MRTVEEWVNDPGKCLKEYREEHSLSLKDAAKLFNTSISNLSDIEHFYHGPSISLLRGFVFWRDKKPYFEKKEEDWLVYKRGQQIAYVPTHANGDLKHPDVEFGFIMSPTHEANDNGSIFCRYWRKGHPGELRTRANSESTPLNCIVFVDSVDQEVVNKTINEILEGL